MAAKACLVEWILITPELILSATSLLSPPSNVEPQDVTDPSALIAAKADLFAHSW
jgi:hypothetical protein